MNVGKIHIDMAGSTPLTSKIYRLPQSSRFTEFVDFFNLKYMYYAEMIILYNECFIIKLYLEYGFPFMHIFHYRDVKKVNVDHLSKDDTYNEISKQIDAGESFDYIENLPALKRIYCLFEMLRQFYPDILNCEIAPKYLGYFEPFDLEIWGITKVLQKISYS